MNIEIIKTALKDDDHCDAMREIGFELFGFDEYYPSDFWFINHNENLIVYWEKDSSIFECWNKTRDVKINDALSQSSEVKK